MFEVNQSKSKEKITIDRTHSFQFQKVVSWAAHRWAERTHPERSWGRRGCLWSTDKHHIFH